MEAHWHQIPADCSLQLLAIYLALKFRQMCYGLHDRLCTNHNEAVPAILFSWYVHLIPGALPYSCWHPGRTHQLV